VERHRRAQGAAVEYAAITPTHRKESSMNAIAWGHDLDAALKDAQDRHRLLLLDFSAAPM
jgi:hypothetical protein